jgi:hypothetical protein
MLKIWTKSSGIAKTSYYVSFVAVFEILGTVALFALLGVIMGSF